MTQSNDLHAQVLNSNYVDFVCEVFWPERHQPLTKALYLASPVHAIDMRKISGRKRVFTQLLEDIQQPVSLSFGEGSEKFQPSESTVYL